MYKKKYGIIFSMILILLFSTGKQVLALDQKPGDFDYVESTILTQTAGHYGSSPFDPPEANDHTFVVDKDGGLDTGCTFRSGGPLIFTIKADRVVGDIALLKANNMISEFAILRMPAWDVDFVANLPPGYFPERDRVFFNGHIVPTDFLTGANQIWKLNAFNIPIEWVNFPSDPGPGGSLTEVDNVIRIDIDVNNSGELWCTAIDWAALSIEVARPVVMAHGILSSGSVWNNIWVTNLNSSGLPNSNLLNMGNLDSIAANANKIAVEVANSKRRWGVDKVVLVAHSKGGIDSREYVESSQDVEEVVQIGTPNAGTPLADAAQASSILLTGLAGTALINALAGPAAIQLTTPYMNTYNLLHGSNPQVRYTALAGAYEPNCPLLNPFCQPLERVLLTITGEGDTIVPKSSVHALSYTHNRTFFSSGNNKDATHTGLPQSNAVFNSISDRIQELGLASQNTNQLSSHFKPTASIGDTIVQGQIIDLPLPIDEQKQAFILLQYPSGDLDLVLITPSGQIIDSTFAEADPNMSHDEGEILGGRMEVYNLGFPEVGVWTARVSAPSVIDPSGILGFSIVAWLEAPAITFTGELAETAVSSGNPLLLIGTIYEAGAPIADASVAAKIALPNDTTQTVSLLDDGTGADDTAGDGIYKGQFTDTTLAGNYRIAFTAERSGSNSGPDFSRQDFAVATVSRSSSKLHGTFVDFGLDSDNDGLFNKLIIEALLDITDNATYRIFAELEDAKGNVLSSNAISNLDSGLVTVVLTFNGERIYQNGVNGPYNLRLIRMAEEDGLSILLVDELTNAYTTAAYSYTEFQHTPIFLTGEGSSATRDIDGNGKFDFLDISIEIQVDNLGPYTWSARLTDLDGTELGFASQSAFFDAGINTLFLSFEGEPIGANGVDGPYYVKDLLVFGGGNSLVATQVLTTQPFPVSQFEGFVGDTTPPIIDVVLNPSMLWPPNHRMVEVKAEITVLDETDPDPEVRLVSITSSESVNETGDGSTVNDL